MMTFWNARLPKDNTCPTSIAEAKKVLCPLDLPHVKYHVCLNDCVLSVIGDKLVDTYLHMRVAKDLWEAHESKFSATDAGSEMYTIEQFHDYKMVENHSVLEQAHEIQCIAKELEIFKCELPVKFVVGCIIAKLPNLWRNFAITLK